MTDLPELILEIEELVGAESFVKKRLRFSCKGKTSKEAKDNFDHVIKKYKEMEK